MKRDCSIGARQIGRSCLVIIPAHNEEADIASVINQVYRYADFDMVVVDDASTDATAARARKAGAQVMTLPVQLGAWGATQTGIRHAVQQGYDLALTMDADGQHEALWMENLLQPVLSGDADVAIGCCVNRGSRLRKIAWKLMKAVSGLSRADITSGFRAYNDRALRILASREASLLEYQDVGVLALLHSAGLKITDIEVTMLPRRSGYSRVFYSWLVVFWYMCHTLILSFSKRGVARARERRETIRREA